MSPCGQSSPLPAPPGAHPFQTPPKSSALDAIRVQLEAQRVDPQTRLLISLVERAQLHHARPCRTTEIFALLTPQDRASLTSAPVAGVRGLALLLRTAVGKADEHGRCLRRWSRSGSAMWAVGLLANDPAQAHTQNPYTNTPNNDLYRILDQVHDVLALRGQPLNVDAHATQCIDVVFDARWPTS